MTDNVVAIRPGRLTLSRIVYHCDLQREAGHIIPLGVIAEMTYGPVRVLGLIARVRLKEQEAGLVGRVLRDRLATPFEFLKDDFEWAWANTGRGEALGRLAERHTQSLLYVPPQLEMMRKRGAPSTSLMRWATEMLRKRRDAEFDALVDNQPGPVKEYSEAA
jgi:hypothetical protein